MREKDQHLSALQQQKKRKISRLYLCAAVLLVILLHISSGFAQNPSGTLAGDQVIWEIDNGVLIIHPAVENDHPAVIDNSYDQDNPWPWKAYSGLIKEVRMWGNISCVSLKDMFSRLTNLQKAFFHSTENKQLKLSDTQDMSNMFNGCTVLEELDISGLDPLTALTDIGGFLAGCNSLKTLNMDDLDISYIPISKEWEKIWWTYKDDPDVKKVLPSLEKLSAQNSRIWLTPYKDWTHSNRNAQLKLMCHEKDGEEICNRMWFKPDVGASRKPEKSGMKYENGRILLNVREWDDLTNDRWTTTLDSMEQGKYDQEGPDWETNPNVAANIGGVSNKGYVDVNGKSTDGHTNINGSGFLAPGIYERTDEENIYWDKLPAAYYRLVGLGYEPPIVSINGEVIQRSGTYKELEAKVTDNGIEIRSIKFSRSEIAKSITRKLDMDPIEIIYPKAVRDIYGNAKSIRLTIKGVTFTDQDQIPFNCEGDNYTEEECTPDRPRNKYSNALRKDDIWYRRLFNISRYSLSFNNYINSDRGQMVKKGSGAEVDFTIDVVDAKPNTTILFYLNDIDVPREQVNERNWYAWNDDGSYDGIIYGEHSEGIQLLDGNDLNEKSITFAKHSGLEIRDIPDVNDPAKLAGKWILATGTDRDRISPWSSVYVRAHADGARYIWTNGVGCTTYMLENSPEFPEIDPVLVLPEARKLLDGAAPKDNYFYAFNFKVEDAKRDVPKVEIPGLDPLPNAPAPMSPLNSKGEHTNRGDDIYFGYIRFDVPKQGTHKAAYVYKVTENIEEEPDPGIIYDTETIYYAQVIITGPVTEEEIARGTRADIYMGERHCDKERTRCGDIIWDRDIPVTVWSSDMKDDNLRTPVKACGSQHEVLQDANGKLFYRHDGKFLSFDPNHPEDEGTELKPVSSAYSKKHHQVSCPDLFTSLYVYEDRNQVDYVYDESNGKYYSPFCHELIEGIDVWPDHADKPIMEKLTASVPKHEGKSGEGYIVHVTKDTIPVEYYYNGDHYHSVIGTMMPVSDGFKPKADDDIVYIEDEILLEEETGRLFYYSDNQYFIYGEDPLGEFDENEKFELHPLTVDTSDIPVAGTFRNYSRDTLTIEKRTIGGKEGSFNFTVLFKNKNFTVEDYEFRDPDTGTIQKADDWSPENNRWKFTLRAGQELSIHNIPEGTEYTVTELPSSDGFSFVSVDEHGTSPSVSGRIDRDKPADHFFDNALTEVMVEKKVIGTDKKFQFTANLEISGLPANEKFYYGIKNQSLREGTADAEGSAQVSLLFTLSHEEKVILIVPYGANVTISEETDNNYTTYVHTEIGDSETIAGHSITLTGVTEDDEVFFTNSRQPDDPDEPDGPSFFRIRFKLPETGFSAVRPQVITEKPMDLNYKPLGWTIQIPELSMQTEIVHIPTVNGKYEVTWLGDAAGLLEGSALPGEGRAVIAGHNHLNTMEAGPFAMLRQMEINNRIFILKPSGELSAFVVYANEKIAEDDAAGLERIANAYPDSLTLITCEDERAEGGYTSRRIVAARKIRN